MSAATSTVAALSFINGKHCRCVWYISGSSTPLFPIPRCRASLASESQTHGELECAWAARSENTPRRANWLAKAR